jgi:Mce-associated membrane protein
VSGGVRRNAAGTKSVPVNEDETPSTAAEIRSLADRADAEAAEAEALAAAARARARAIQLRRQAELQEANEVEAAQEEATEEKSEADAEKPVQSEAQELESATESDGTESAAEPESVDTEESPDEVVEESDADTSSADDAEEKPTFTLRKSRRWRRLRRPRWSTVAATLAIVVILAALSGSVYMILDHRHAVQQRQRAAEFAAAARQGVVNLTSLDFNNAKQGVQRIGDDSTGTFKDDFLKMADDFTKVVEQSKVISQGTVAAAAVDLDTMTDNSAVVLVASTSEVTNAAGAKQDPRNYRLIVTITRDGDQLKMSKVQFVP